MKAHVIDTHLAELRSKSFAKVKVTTKVTPFKKSPFSGALVFTNSACLRLCLFFVETFLFYIDLERLNYASLELHSYFW